MDEHTSKLIASFPHAPYDIQQQFMINVVDTLDKRQIGLFESPTGTGKTLSIICSTLHWLEVERERQQREAAEAAAQDCEGLPDWLAGAQTTPEPPATAQQPHKGQQRHKAAHKAKAAVAPLLDEEGNDLSEFLPDHGSTTAATPNQHQQQQGDTASPGTKRTAPDTGGFISTSEDEDEAAAGAAAAAVEDDVAAAAGRVVQRKRPQIIFCSRTHSQLSQFVGELHRTRFADSILLIAVASRKALCVNQEVRQLSELSQVNERCLELQRNKSSASSSKRKGARHDPPAAAANTSSVVGFSGAPRPPQQQQRRRGSGSGSGGGRSKSGGCPYLSVEGGVSGWEDFADTVLASPMDVEELAALGGRMKICPYYGSRRAVPSADVVLAPYSAVLLPDARDSLGIELSQDTVLVFDEAHNLLDALNSAHSTTVTAWQLLSVQRSLTAYYDRFKAVLNPVNAQHIHTLLNIAAALHSCLSVAATATTNNNNPQHQHQQQQQQQGPNNNNNSSSGSSSSRVVTVNDLLFDLGLDDINMLQLAHWVKDNKMAFKVSGYTAAAVDKAGGSIQLQQRHTHHSVSSMQVDTALPDSSSWQQGQQDQGQHKQQQQQQPSSSSLGQLSSKDGVSAIHAFVSFLLSLTHADADGRVIVDPAAAPQVAASTTAAAADSPAATAAAQQQQPGARGGQLRYVLLNAAGHFGKLLASARSVLLVSGTLAPIEGLQAQLFPDAAPERVRHFECGHVVPREQLLTVSIGRGPSGRALNLKHESRGDVGMMGELGQLLLNLCGVVPEGLVVFVPSFGYLQQLSSAWRASGLWERLAQRKQVFCEPRASTEVEAVLAAYAAAISGADDAAAAPSSNTNTPTSAVAAAAAAPGNNTNTSAAAAAAAAGGGGGGALMLCVVGGKLSEGINFGDGLGRCVVVVGLPYPNRTDVELQARMQYLDRMAAQAAAAGKTTPTTAAAPQPPAGAQGQQPEQHEPEQQQQQQGQPVAAPVRRSAFHVINRGVQQPQAQAQPQAAAAVGVSEPGDPTTAAAHSAEQQPQPQQQGSAAAAAGSTPPAKPSATTPTSSSSSSSIKCITGREYYEDLCFKAVNQCVGRVVRHKGDYAAVVLLDSRWVTGPAEWAAMSAAGGGGSGVAGGGGSSSRKAPVQKLPGWLRRSYVPTNGDFGPALKQLAAFYKRQRSA